MAKYLIVTALFAALAMARSQNSTNTLARAKQEKLFPQPDFVLRDAKHKEPKSGVQMSPDGQIAIMQGVGTPTVINTLSFSADGKLLAAGKDFGRVIVWDVPGRKFLRSLETGQGIVSAVALSPDGKVVATGGSGDQFSVKLWDVPSGKLLKTFKLGEGSINSVAFCPTGKWLAVSDNATKTYVLDVATGTPVFTQGDAYGAGFSRDETLFVTANPKGFSVWTTPNWSLSRTIPWSHPIPTIIAFDSATDRMAVYQAWDVRLKYLSTGEAIEGLADVLPKSSTGYPKFAELSADGSLVYVHAAGRLWVWDTQTNKTCGTPVMYSGAGALSGDNHWLAGSKDDSILSKERTDGVWVWETSHLLAACNLRQPTVH